jgi:hypothetical protein
MRFLLIAACLLASFASSEAAAKNGKVKLMKDGTLACVDSSGTIVEGPTGKWRTNTPTTIGNACESMNKAVVPPGDVLDGFDGPRIDVRIGYDAIGLDGNPDLPAISNGVSYGLEAGYDWPIGNRFVAGAYLRYEFSNYGSCDSPICLREDGNPGAGGRVGIAASNLLFYGKLGYARIGVESFNARGRVTTSRSGIEGGLGLNVGLDRRIYGLAEANYADFGDIQGAGLHRWQFAAGAGLRF